MNKILAIGSIALLSASTAFANPPSDMRASMDKDLPAASEANLAIRNANQAYQSIVMNSKKGKVPDNVLAKARCIVSIANIKTGAAVIGASHGDGVATCRNNGAWSPPILVDLNDASFGAQIGGKSTDLVLFLNDERSANALKQGKFRVGADASVALGSYDAAATTAPIGVYAYQQSDGAYLGASVAGGTISADEEANQAVYGKDVRCSEILAGRGTASANEEGRSFLDQLPT